MRVIATAGVLVVHVNQRAPLPGIFGRIASFGADGLTCFYILSAFLVMHSWEGRNSTKEYWRKRVSRILPLYYFWLLILAVFRSEWIQKDPFAILRAVFMLEYLAPPTVSYEYCSMYLIGVVSIFMMLYAMIPIVSRYIKSIGSAFVAFWLSVLLMKIAPSIFGLLYGGISNQTALDTMTSYLFTAFPCFMQGILLYYGKKENNYPKLLAYQLFILVASMRYDFLDITRTATVSMLVGLLLFFAPRIKGEKILRWLDQFGMGVFIVQALCFEVWESIASHYALSASIRTIGLIIFPYCIAVVVHYCIEIPGKKIINKLMT